MVHRIFSGVKPSGLLHLGNYLGAMKGWVALQEHNRCIFSIVDLHAITVPQDPKELRQHTREAAAMYLACGIDPSKVLMFVQSDVVAHSELCWILNTLTKVSELKLMHQYKEKSKEEPEHITMGLFDYPVLMAADILLYKSTLVPVGEDQKQHLELARELARRFNARFGEIFVVPEGYIPDAGARIMALDNPHKKMSKSDRSSHSYIALTDSYEEIRNKIGRAVTDSGNEIAMHHDKPALTNLLTIYHAMSGLSFDEIERRYAGKGYKEFKEGLSEVINDHLVPIQKRYQDWLLRPEELNVLLKECGNQARGMADATMREVRDAVGLGA